MRLSVVTMKTYVRTYTLTVMAGTRLESDVTVLPYVPITSLRRNLVLNMRRNT